MFIITERFVSKLENIYGPLPIVFTDGGTWFPLQDCSFLKLTHPFHSSLRKASSLREPFNTYKIGPRISMIIFHVERKIAN
jgi:hypothetical protein